MSCKCLPLLSLLYYLTTFLIYLSIGYAVFCHRDQKTWGGQRSLELVCLPATNYPSNPSTVSLRFNVSTANREKYSNTESCHASRSTGKASSCEVKRAVVWESERSTGVKKSEKKPWHIFYLIFKIPSRPLPKHLTRCGWLGEQAVNWESKKYSTLSRVAVDWDLSKKENKTLKKSSESIVLLTFKIPSRPLALLVNRPLEPWRVAVDWETKKNPREKIFKKNLNRKVSAHKTIIPVNSRHLHRFPVDRSPLSFSTAKVARCG